MSPYVIIVICSAARRLHELNCPLRLIPSRCQLGKAPIHFAGRRCTVLYASTRRAAWSWASSNLDIYVGSGTHFALLFLPPVLPWRGCVGAY
jgi:hypothetical protein